MENRRSEPTAFARELRRLREQAGLSLSELARQAGVSKGYVSSLEAGGKYRGGVWEPLEPSRRVLGDLVGALNWAGVRPEVTDYLYAILRLDPPPRTDEDAEASRFRGIPAGVPVDDLGDDALKAIVHNVQRILRERGSDVGGSSGSSRAKDGQKAS